MDQGRKDQRYVTDKALDYVDGAAGEPFFQKRAPEQRPEWIETVELRFPSGRTAREIVVRDAAQLLWVVNLGCIDF